MLSSQYILSMSLYFFFFFFYNTSTTDIYTLSLHDALPISQIEGIEWVVILIIIAVLLLFGPSKLPELRDDEDRKSTRLNSSHVAISYAVFCLKKKKNNHPIKNIED